MANLKGKYAIVTGGGKGLGAAIARRFSEEQAAGIAILDYDLALAEKTADELDGNVIAVGCDVADEEQVKEAVGKVLAAFGRIDILVNNAGIIRDSMFHKMDGDQWHQVINVNLNGLYYCCKYVVPLMREQNYGKIINLSSTSANGNAGQTNYSATKAAVEGFTKSLAKECARKNITVNAIAPGAIDSRPGPAACTNFLGHPGKCSDVAALALLLASDEGGFMTGDIINIDGGRTLGCKDD